MDSYTGQPVALKLLSVRRGRRFDHTTFALEARALGVVSAHPNIVTLHRATIRPDGQPLLVLELCQGSLSDRLAAHGPMSVQAAMSIGVKLASALETAHRAGVLHRDLKPHNVLLTRYEEPALADFGVAELRDAISGGSPLSGVTLLHAAPEVILGKPATPASDVYGLVSTLYELMSGRPPHFVTPDEDPAVLQRRVLHDPVPRLDAPGLPLAVRELLEGSLAKSPDDRPASALELAQGLRLLERANGWPVTPCRVDGTADLPLPEPGSAPPPTLGRAATTTGIPPLGLGTRPLSEPSSFERDLEPAPARSPEILPAAPRDLLPIRDEDRSVGGPPSSDEPPTTEPPTTEPAPTEPAPTEPAPTEPPTTEPDRTPQPAAQEPPAQPPPAQPPPAQEPTAQEPTAQEPTAQEPPAREPGAPDQPDADLAETFWGYDPGTDPPTRRRDARAASTGWHRRRWWGRRR